MKIVNRVTAENHNVKKLNGSKLPQNLICFSHLRWDFVFQRPQHLLTRFAKAFNVFFIEEPVFDATDKPHYTFSKRGESIWTVVPHIAPGHSAEEVKTIQKNLFEHYMENRDLSDYAFWYYTPMALEFSRKFTPEVLIYDCMDELSAFKFAPESLKILERELLQKADVVFTGGHSLYQAKKNQHANIHPFPSSIEKEHFAEARKIKGTKDAAASAYECRLGFYGVIDERFDIDLIKGIADLRPNWQLNIIGPVVKIDPATLPQNTNIKYHGSQDYKALPSHLCNWDIALIPFLLNESTKFISPTKTPEYLSAGLPVISTAITDVVNPYGKHKLVSIASSAEEFVAAAESYLTRDTASSAEWLRKVDTFLSQTSWDKTYQQMLNVITQSAGNKSLTSIAL